MDRPICCYTNWSNLVKYSQNRRVLFTCASDIVSIRHSLTRTRSLNACSSITMKQDLMPYSRYIRAVHCVVLDVIHFNRDCPERSDITAPLCSSGLCCETGGAYFALSSVRFSADGLSIEQKVSKLLNMTKAWFSAMALWDSYKWVVF